MLYEVITRALLGPLGQATEPLRHRETTAGGNVVADEVLHLRVPRRLDQRTVVRGVPRGHEHRRAVEAVDEQPRLSGPF